MKNVSVKNFSNCENIFYACKSTLADSIIIQDCIFNNIRNGFVLSDEKDNKGYYNVEKIRVTNNQFINGDGVLLDLYRGGSDESTLGPNLAFSANTINNYNSTNNDALIQLTGVQKTRITGNVFKNSNASKPLIIYKDNVRASHYLSHNTFIHSGSLLKNNFVTEGEN